MTVLVNVRQGAGYPVNQVHLASLRKVTPFMVMGTRDPAQLVATVWCTDLVERPVDHQCLMTWPPHVYGITRRRTVPPKASPYIHRHRLQVLIRLADNDPRAWDAVQKVAAK